MSFYNFFQKYYSRNYSLEEENASPIPLEVLYKADVSMEDISQYIAILTKIYTEKIQVSRIQTGLDDQKKLLLFCVEKGLISRENADQFLNNNYILSVSKRDVLCYGKKLCLPRPFGKFRYRIEVKLSGIDLTEKYLNMQYGICFATNHIGETILKRRCSDGELRLLTENDFRELYQTLKNEQSYLYEQLHYLQSIELQNPDDISILQKGMSWIELYELTVEKLTHINISYEKIYKF